MSSFDDLLADANDAFTDAFAESVKIIYRPAGGLPRPISAIIDRHPAALIEGENRPQPVTEDLEIIVDNDPITGILGRDIQVKRDQVSLPVRFGDTSQKNLLIVKIVNQDGGKITLRCR